MIRLYVPQQYSAGQHLTLAEAQVHYLLHVMRCVEGTEIAVFNGTQGEWLASISVISKKKAEITLKQQVKPQPVEKPLALYFAPIKSARLEYMVEKAVELGVTHFRPVMTQHTIMNKVNVERLQAHAVEAAEQCERLSVPHVENPIPLSNLYGKDSEERIILADESGAGKPIYQLMLGDISPLGLLIGPEGGFSKDELAKLRSLDFIIPASLGPRVLRADTAALAAITACQMLTGDWNERPRFTPAQD